MITSYFNKMQIINVCVDRLNDANADTYMAYCTDWVLTELPHCWILHGLLNWLITDWITSSETYMAYWTDWLLAEFMASTYVARWIDWLLTELPHPRLLHGWLNWLIPDHPVILWLHNHWAMTQILNGQVEWPDPKLTSCMTWPQIDKLNDLTIVYTWQGAAYTN